MLSASDQKISNWWKGRTGMSDEAIAEVCAIIYPEESFEDRVNYWMLRRQSELAKTPETRGRWDGLAAGALGGLEIWALMFDKRQGTLSPEGELKLKEHEHFVQSRSQGGYASRLLLVVLLVLGLGSVGLGDAQSAVSAFSSQPLDNVYYVKYRRLMAWLRSWTRVHGWTSYLHSTESRTPPAFA